GEGCGFQSPPYIKGSRLPSHSTKSSGTRSQLMQVSRRDFLRVSAGAGAGTAIGGMVGLGVTLAPAMARAQELRIKDAKTTPSICPFCSVGCATLIHTVDGKIVNIEGDPRSPHNEGTLCPKGAAIYQLHMNPNRATKVLHRKPGASDWQVVELEWAMDRAAALNLLNLEYTDWLVIVDSNMAVCQLVAVRGPMKAKLNGAKLIHVDPRFTRTSAVADLHVPIRAGSDIAFLGGLIYYVINSKRWNSDPFFKEFAVNYTNAATIISDDFKDTEDLDGVFSGMVKFTEPAFWPYNGLEGRYDNATWAYKRGPKPPRAEIGAVTPGELYRVKPG